MTRRVSGIALLAASVFMLLAGARVAIATHGSHIVYTEGAVGAAGWTANSLCDVSNSQLVIAPPTSVTASYDTTNLPSQRVWWTPRIWWVRNDTGVLEHEEWAFHGWYWAWARTGDNHGDIVVFPDRGSIGGGAYPSWSDSNDVTQPLDFTVPIPVHTEVAKQFWVEHIFYWQPTQQQPLYGWDAGLGNFYDDLLTVHGNCTFP